MKTTLTLMQKSTRFATILCSNMLRLVFICKGRMPLLSNSSTADLETIPQTDGEGISF